MEEKALKRLAINSIAFMMTIILISTVFTKANNTTIYADDMTSLKPQQMAADGKFNLLNEELYETIKISEDDSDGNTKEIISELGNRYIVIDKPRGNSVSLSLQDIYMKNTVRIEIAGLEDKNIDYNSILRVKDGNEYIGMPDVKDIKNINGEEIETGNSKEVNAKNDENISSEDILKDISIAYNYNSDTQEYIAALNLVLDRIYVHTVYQDNEHFYIKLEHPRQVYENILVLDVGHGGTDVGCYTEDLKFFEKNLNLDIALRTKKYLENNKKIKVYYTRLEDEKVYLNPRVNLANELKADFFLSIHCNSSETKQAYGTEVLYGGKSKAVRKISEKYASKCLEKLIDSMGTRNRGIILRNDVYIIGNSNVPVALVETAYISNKEDFKFLSKEENREKIAEGIYKGIVEIFEEK